MDDVEPVSQPVSTRQTRKKPVLQFSSDDDDDFEESATKGLSVHCVVWRLLSLLLSLNAVAFLSQPMFFVTEKERIFSYAVTTWHLNCFNCTTCCYTSAATVL